MKLSKKQKQHRKLSKKVMQVAWKVARRAAQKFGLKASDYICSAIKYAWRALRPQQLELFEVK